MITAVVLYSFVGFLVGSALLRNESMHGDLFAVLLCCAAAMLWAPVMIAALVLVAFDAALAVRRI